MGAAALLWASPGLAGPSPADEPARAASGGGDAHDWLVDWPDEGGDPEKWVPPFLDLRRLRIRTERMAWGGSPPRPVVTAVLETAPGPGSYPAGTRLRLHLAFGREPAGDTTAQADLTLILRMVERAFRQDRRRAPAGGVPAAVARFDGFDGLGDLSSLIPGRSVTFRLPLGELWRQATPEQQRTAAHDDGSWSLQVWAESEGPQGWDRLPARPGAESATAQPASIPLSLPLPGP